MGRGKWRVLIQYQRVSVWEDFFKVLEKNGGDGCTTMWMYLRSAAAAAAAKSLQSCPTLCDPIDSSPRGTPVPRILQAKTLEWVAISFSNAWKWKAKVKSLSCVRLLTTPWTAAYWGFFRQESMRFFRQEYWSGLPLPSPIIDFIWLLKELGERKPG